MGPLSTRRHVRALCASSKLVFCAALLAAPAAAQTGPGLPRRVFEPGQLFRPIATISTGLHGQSLLHDGWLTILRYNPGGVGFYDISNPYAPRRVASIVAGMEDLNEPHTVAQTTAYGGEHVVLLRGPGSLGGTGFAIWDWTEVSAAQRRVAYDVPGVPGGYATGIFWLFYQAPYVFCGAGSLGLYVVDASDPTSPVVARHIPTSQTGGFNVVNTLAVGNTLIVTNSDGGPGMARFDISDPTNPVLLHATTNTSTPYGLGLNGARLLVPAVSGPISQPTGANGAFELRDALLPSFPVLGEIALPSRGGSALLQDGYAHVAASLAYLKIDLRNPEALTVVGSAFNNNSGGDWDWATPMSNLAVIGDDQGFGTFLVPHDTLPDNIGPAVTMVDPPDGATHRALSSRLGVTFSDMVELASLDANSFFVRPVGGTALAGSYSNQFGIVNFSPSQPLEPDTTYEVVVPAGGVRDWAGNATTSTFLSRFSTGGAVTAIEVSAAPTAPALPGEPVSFDVTASSGPGPFQYSWDFGDGTPPTPFSSSSQAVHAYVDVGHHAVVVTATNGTLTGTDSFLQTVHHPVTPLRPTHSSTIVLDEARGRVWCVNADNDTVSAFDASTLVKELEVPVGAQPRTLAVAPDGAMWVVCQDEAKIRVLDGESGAALGSIALPYASAPYGLALSPDGSAAWVTLRARGQVARLDPFARLLLGTIDVGPEPRGIAVAADSERVFATRFLSSSNPARVARATGAAWRAQARPPLPRQASPAAEVYELSAAASAWVQTIPLALDPGPDTETSGRGLPNYLGSPAITPDGLRLWVPSKKDNLERGLYRDGLPLDFQSTVRTIVSQVDLVTGEEDLAARIDFNDRDMAVAVAHSPLGDWAFHALQGSNAIDVRDAYTGALVAEIQGTGLAPQGLALSSDGARLFVHNFLSRTVAAYDASGVTSATDFALTFIAQAATVESERLSTQVLRGKRIFYDASDPRMNEDGYLSCASCHLDGGHDGSTWDFTDRGEGLRNTISLLGKSGRQGKLHWTANFDEVQDFENDIRLAFGGNGFLTVSQFNATANPLGPPKAGLSADLDALAAYVASLQDAGRSPHRDPDGSLTPAGERGKNLFQSLGCTTCHAGVNFTDSTSGLLHDVGTLRPSSGQASGGALLGLDTPTLRSLWTTAPYLHDGSAPTLFDVLFTRNPQGLHGPTQALGAAEREDVIAYLLQIDDLESGPSGEAR